MRKDTSSSLAADRATERSPKLTRSSPGSCAAWARHPPSTRHSPRPCRRTVRTECRVGSWAHPCCCCSCSTHTRGQFIVLPLAPEHARRLGQLWACCSVMLCGTLSRTGSGTLAHSDATSFPLLAMVVKALTLTRSEGSWKYVAKSVLHVQSDGTEILGTATLC